MKNRIKIAFLAPEFFNAWGGVGIYSLSLISGLSAFNNLDLHVITPDVPNKVCRNKVKKKFKNNVKFHLLSTAKDTFLYNLKFQYMLFAKFSKLHEKYGFDLIHSANLVHMPDIFLKFKKLGIPSLVTTHTTIRGQVSGFLQGNKNFFRMAPSEKASLLAYPYISVMERMYLARTDAMITVSHTFKKILKHDYNYSKPIYAIHNCIDPKHYNDSKISTKKAYTHFPSLKHLAGPLVLFAGRLVSQKGISVFFDAIEKLESEGKHYNYLFAGKGDEELVSTLMNDKKINPSRIHRLGYIENSELVYLLKLTDIFVLPSYYENLPISLLEAMSMRNACIATDVGAVSEIIDDKKTGIILSAGDVKGLAQAIITLAENKTLRKKLADAGRKKAITQFKPQLMAKKTLEVYESLIKKGVQ